MIFAVVINRTKTKKYTKQDFCKLMDLKVKWLFIQFWQSMNIPARIAMGIIWFYLSARSAASRSFAYFFPASAFKTWISLCIKSIIVMLKGFALELRPGLRPASLFSTNPQTFCDEITAHDLFD
jgi:hypothetical protein